MGWRIILPALIPSGPRSSSRLLALTANALLAAAAVGVSALAFEAAARLFFPQERPFDGLSLGDPVVGLRGRPHLDLVLPMRGGAFRVRTTSLGYRGPERDWDGRPRLRVLALGDSFTFGAEVAEEDTFAARLESALGPGAEVVNAGHPGTGPDNARLLLAADGPRLRPHFVVFTFFVGNDLGDVLTGPWRVGVRDGLLHTTEGVLDRWYRPLVPGRLLPVALPTARGGGIPVPFKQWLRARSHAFRFLSRRYQALKARWSAPAPLARGARVYTLFELEAFCLREYAPEQEEAWARARAELLAMKRWCDGRGAGFALAIAPTRAQVYPEEWEEQRRRFGLREADFDLEKPQALLRAFAEANGIDAVDLLPAFRARRADPLYGDDRVHWSARGHAVAAEEILRALRARDLAAPPGQ
jgi:lysophospholipase L1-like esterase